MLLSLKLSILLNIQRRAIFHILIFSATQWFYGSPFDGLTSLNSIELQVRDKFGLEIQNSAPNLAVVSNLIL